MTSSLTRLTLAQARKGLRAKEFTARELAEDYLQAMEETRDLNAYITETPDIALAQAAESDRRLLQGNSRSLEGIPLAIKDLFCTRDIETTAASRILKGFIPSYESAITQRLLNAGTVTLGKTNLDEFAMGSSNITSAYGPVMSPWKNKHFPEKNLVPGGSSGGSSAVVAAGSALAALGTDTGGSIRQPASFCGVVGIKPTYGRCSRWGTIAFASSLDQAGPLTRTVQDAAILLEVMAGHDPRDATSAPRAVPPFEKAIGQSIRGLKVGVPQEYVQEGMDATILALWEKGKAWLRDAGAEIVPISLPHTRYALPTYYVLAPAEASSNLARYDGVRFGARVGGETLDDFYINTRTAGFGLEVKRRIITGTYVLSSGYYDAHYVKAQKVRTLIAQDFNHAFDKVDMIFAPSTPTAAFALGEEPTDPITMYLNDIFTVPTSLAGLPAISVPAGLNPDGLPLGLQVIGRLFDEETVFKAGYILEQAADFPPLPFMAGVSPR